MIRLTDVHYAAIGRVTVESCTLDRELHEYLGSLGLPKPPQSIGKKLKELRPLLRSNGSSAVALQEFSAALRKVRELIDQRNALAHGVWIPHPSPSTFASTAALGKTSVPASQVAVVAAKLRAARKLLLRLFQDHLPQAVPNRKPITASASKLMQQL